jgi:adenosine deaminase
MSLQSFIRAMPKVELHVHFIGSMRPATLVKLAQKHGRELPEPGLAAELRWPGFRDFLHFRDAYTAASGAVRSAEDIELVAREFLEDQAAQGIVYSEVTFTAHGNHCIRGIPISEQLAALRRAREWAESNLGVTMRVILDIPRERSPEETLVVADWAIEGMSEGVVGVGLAGDELGGPAERFVEAFGRAKAAGLARVPHAGEIAGPQSIRNALRELDATRIDHGVRCLEDPELVAELRDRQIPLDVCPTSNVCTGVFASLESHALPRMLEVGLNVTIGSDDPPMFNTTLTGEYLAICEAYGWGAAEVERLVLNGVRASLLPERERSAMETLFETEIGALRREHGV